MTERAESSNDEIASGTAESIERYDELEIYCSKLGHAVRFSYCRRAGGSFPCSRILDCWGRRIAVRPFLQAHFTPAELERALAPPRPKMQQILDIVARLQVRKAAADSTTGDVAHHAPASDEMARVHKEAGTSESSAPSPIPRDSRGPSQK